jgi:hypothetical protein
MTARAHTPIRDLAHRALLGAALAAALSTATAASAQTLFMRIDGVKGENPEGQPLGADAFPALGFTLATDPMDPAKNLPIASDDARFENMSFTLPVSGPAVSIWQLAAERKEVPKASLALLDKATGAIRLRIDLEQVVVRSLGLQSVASRAAAAGELSYQRIRIRFGDGKDVPTASWDRARHAPWK